MRVPDRIVGSRTVIRRLRPDDHGAFVSFITSAGDTSQFMFSGEHKSHEGADSFFHSVIVSYKTEAPYFVLAIVGKARDVLMGLCGLSGLHEPGILEPFCALSESERGTGYATDAISSLIDYCFAQRLAREVRVHINPHNHRSVRMAARLGFEFVGQRDHPMTGEKCLAYAMESTAWNERKNRRNV